MSKWILLTLTISVVFAPCTHAFDFRPTRAEWMTWPEYCQAKYVNTNVGSASSFRALVSKETVEHWRGALGEDTWLHIHHGCAGFIWILRAERLSKRQGREFEFALDKAGSEATYAIQRIPPSHPLHQKLKLVLARAEYLRGNPAACFSMIDQVLADAPDLAEAYAVYATYLYREAEWDRARSILERGLETVPNPTAEMHYFLGLVLLRQKDYEQARVQAEEAYRLGYPLPGLRRRLKSLGHWDT